MQKIKQNVNNVKSDFNVLQMARIVTDFAETFLNWNRKLRNQHSFSTIAYQLPWK